MSNINELLEKHDDFYGKFGFTYEFRSPEHVVNLVLEHVDLNQCDECSSDNKEQFRPLNSKYNMNRILVEHDCKDSYLNEAIISTYPKQKVIDRFKSFCKSELDSSLVGLKMNEVLKNRTEDMRIVDWNDCSNGLIEVYLPMFVDQDEEDFMKKFIKSMFICGWNVAEIRKFGDKSIIQPFNDADSEIQILRVYFEPRYSRPIDDFSDVLYHVSPSRYYRKIKKMGLVPRSNSDIFKYPERVYLFNSNDVELVKSYGKFKLCSMPDDEVEDSILIYRILKEKLIEHPLYRSGKLKFYHDPKYNGNLPMVKPGHPAIFTYGNIPRELIEDDVIVIDQVKYN